MRHAGLFVRAGALFWKRRQPLPKGRQVAVVADNSIPVLVPRSDNDGKVSMRQAEVEIVPTDRIKQVLAKVYTEHPTMGINRLVEHIRAQYWGISRTQVGEYLRHISTRQQYQRPPTQKARIQDTRRVSVTYMNQMWMGDSSEFTKDMTWWPCYAKGSGTMRKDKNVVCGYTALIDVFTRYAWVLPYKGKSVTEKDTIKCFKDAVTWCRTLATRNTDHQRQTYQPLHDAWQPATVQTDNGKEYGSARQKHAIDDMGLYNDSSGALSWDLQGYKGKVRQKALTAFQLTLQGEGVARHQVPPPYSHAWQQHIERFNLSFKKILRQLVLSGHTNRRVLAASLPMQLRILRDVCEIYNNTPHDSLPSGLTPKALAIRLLSGSVGDTDAEDVNTTRQRVLIHRAAKASVNKAGSSSRKQLEDLYVGQTVLVAFRAGVVKWYTDIEYASSNTQNAAARRHRDDHNRRAAGRKTSGGRTYSETIYVITAKHGPKPAQASNFNEPTSYTVRPRDTEQPRTEYTFPATMRILRRDLLAVDLAKLLPQ